MKVFILPDSKLMEDYAEIHCVKETETIRKLADYIEVDTRYIIGKNDRQTKHLPIHEIYYFESIDKRTFVYLENEVWEVTLSLREIEERLAFVGFCRINKSVIVNLRKIKLLKNDFEMRIVAQLENQELLIINRHYKKAFETQLNQLKASLSEGAHESNS